MDMAFASDHKWDRNFFLLWVGLVWFGIIAGFGGDIVRHVQSHEAHYPLIVHVHAAVFVGWLVLFTVQIWLIRSRRHDIHKKLGIGLLCLAAVMIVIGPATAWVVQRQEFGTPDSDPSFVAIQFSDIVAFTGLVSAGFLSRDRPSMHKRLMLLATLYISDAGFARFLFGPVTHMLGHGYLATVIGFYGATDLLVLGLGAYDLITRKRLHPAYIAGAIWVFANQLTAVYLLQLPAWKPIATHLIGH